MITNQTNIAPNIFASLKIISDLVILRTRETEKHTSVFYQ